MTIYSVRMNLLEQMVNRKRPQAIVRREKTCAKCGEKFESVSATCCPECRAEKNRSHARERVRTQAKRKKEAKERESK